MEDLADFHFRLLHPYPTPQQTNKPTSRLIISIKVILGLRRRLGVLRVHTAFSGYQSSVPRSSQSPVTPTLEYPLLTSALYGHLNTDNSTHRHTCMQMKNKFKNTNKILTGVQPACICVVGHCFKAEEREEGGQSYRFLPFHNRQPSVPNMVFS